MSPAPSVRELSAAEWPVYRELRLRALADAPDAFSKTLAEEERRSDAEWSELVAATAASPSQAAFVARLGDRAVGILYTRLAAETPELAHLHAMWVEPAARCKGLGRALVEAALAWARARGAQRIELQATEGNAPAMGLYRRAGFEPTDRLEPLRPGSALRVRTLRLDLSALSPLDCNYLESQRIFMGFSDTGEYVERRGAAIASCGLRVRELNSGFLKPPYDDVEAAAAGVRAWFAERALPFRLAFRGSDRARCAPPLEALGWRAQSDPVPGMTLALPAAPPAPPSALTIDEVRTRAQLAAFRDAAFRGFGYPVAAAHLFLNERLLALPRVRLYAGLAGGVVVSTSMLIATGEVAGIYWVATVAEQRGRGYGEALTWAAAGGGRAFGCTVASLQASKLGRPVYARMGFAHVLDYEYLHPPEEGTS